MENENMENAQAELQEDFTESEPMHEDVIEEEAVALIDFDGEISALESEFPGVNISEDSERYRELRALGLSPREAYFASASKSYKFDTRSHLTSAMPKRATSPTGSMSVREMAEARELFPGLSDRQIENLYKSVNK